MLTCMHDLHVPVSIVTYRAVHLHILLVFAAALPAGSQPARLHLFERLRSHSNIHCRPSESPYAFQIQRAATKAAFFGRRRSDDGVPPLTQPLRFDLGPDLGSSAVGEDTALLSSPEEALRAELDRLQVRQIVGELVRSSMLYSSEDKGVCSCS